MLCSIRPSVDLLVFLQYGVAKIIKKCFVTYVIVKHLLFGLFRLLEAACLFFDHYLFKLFALFGWVAYYYFKYV